MLLSTDDTIHGDGDCHVTPSHMRCDNPSNQASAWKRPERRPTVEDKCIERRPHPFDSDMIYKRALWHTVEVKNGVRVDPAGPNGSTSIVKGQVRLIPRSVDSLFVTIQTTGMKSLNRRFGRRHGRIVRISA